MWVIYCCSGCSFSTKCDHGGVSCGVHSLFPSAKCLLCSSLFYQWKFITEKMIILVLPSTHIEDNGAELGQMGEYYITVLAESLTGWDLCMLLEAANVLSSNWVNTFILWAPYIHISSLFFFFFLTKHVLRERVLSFNLLLIFCTILECSCKALKFCIHSRLMLQLQKRCSALEIGEEGDLPSGEVSETAELQICFCTKGKRREIAVGESLVCGMEAPIYHTDLNS